MGYKEEKEAFVSNLNGTSMGEIALVSCLLPAGLFLRASLWRAIGITAVQRLPAAAIWLVEFATVAMPPLLSLVAPEQVPAMTLGAVMQGCGSYLVHDVFLVRLSVGMGGPRRGARSAPVSSVWLDSELLGFRQ